MAHLVVVMPKMLITHDNPQFLHRATDARASPGPDRGLSDGRPTPGIEGADRRGAGGKSGARLWVVHPPSGKIFLQSFRPFPPENRVLALEVRSDAGLVYFLRGFACSGLGLSEGYGDGRCF